SRGAVIADDAADEVELGHECQERSRAVPEPGTRGNEYTRQRERGEQRTESKRQADQPRQAHRQHRARVWKILAARMQIEVLVGQVERVVSGVGVRTEE